MVPPHTRGLAIVSAGVVVAVEALEIISAAQFSSVTGGWYRPSRQQHPRPLARNGPSENVCYNALHTVRSPRQFGLSLGDSIPACDATRKGFVPVIPHCLHFGTSTGHHLAGIGRKQTPVTEVATVDHVIAKRRRGNPVRVDQVPSRRYFLNARARRRTPPTGLSTVPQARRDGRGADSG